MLGYIEPGVIVPFLLAVAMIELTPGPNMSWLAIVAARRGRRAALACVAGVTLGLGIWMLAAVLGVGRVLIEHRSVYEVIRWAGVVYLLWLAWEAWSAPSIAGTEADRTDRADGDRRALFLRGLGANLLNPKVAAFYTALLPTFIREERGAVTAQSLTFGALHLLVATGVHTLIVVSAAGAGAVALRHLDDRRARALMAAGIALIALWMAWETRGRSA